MEMNSNQVEEAGQAGDKEKKLTHFIWLGYWLNAFYIAKLEDEEIDEDLIEESEDVAVKIGEIVLAEEFGLQRAIQVLKDGKFGIDKRFFKYCFKMNAMLANLIHRDE